LSLFSATVSSLCCHHKFFRESFSCAEWQSKLPRYNFYSLFSLSRCPFSSQHQSAFSSARSGLGRSCFLFACGTSLVSDSRRKQQHEFPRAPRQGPFPQIFPPAAASGGQRSFSCQKWFPLWILSPCRDLVLAAVLRSIFFWPRDFGLA
jgi:hypothetical protein